MNENNDSKYVTANKESNVMFIENYFHIYVTLVELT